MTVPRYYVVDLVSSKEEIVRVNLPNNQSRSFSFTLDDNGNLLLTEVKP